jgi:hypothetical protein
MSLEPTAPATPEGQEPEGAATGQEPNSATQNEPQGGKTFDEAYVKGLRKEAATHRNKASELESELNTLRDRDKSEGQRLTDRVAESERRAAAAETKALRFEIAAERGLNLVDAMMLAGQTREEIEAAADHWAERMATSQPSKPPGFDGGARQTPEETKPPEQAHNDLLLRAIGRSTS